MGGGKKAAGSDERKHAFASLGARRVACYAFYDARYQAQNEAFEIYDWYSDHNPASACADGGSIISFMMQEITKWIRKNLTE